MFFPSVTLLNGDVWQEIMLGDCIDREFVISAKKIANFNEFFEIKKIRKNS